MVRNTLWCCAQHGSLGSSGAGPILPRTIVPLGWAAGGTATPARGSSPVPHGSSGSLRFAGVTGDRDLFWAVPGVSSPLGHLTGLGPRQGGRCPSMEVATAPARLCLADEDFQARRQQLREEEETPKEGQ